MTTQLLSRRGVNEVGGRVTPRTRNVTYWICTALVAFVMISGGFVNTFVRESIDGLIKLGYPAYFAAILGVWKMLGGITVLVPGFPRVKEWAYAGIMFELTGAGVSNAAAGAADSWVVYAGHIAAPLVIAAVAVASWALRPNDRMLGPAVARWEQLKAA